MDENRGNISTIKGGSEFNVRSKSNNTSSIMDQIQQIVGKFPTVSKGKAMLDAYNS